MGKFLIRTIALVWVLSLPTLAFAAGLGKLTVLSGLGQPLKAEIELLSLQKGEADNISVRLATPDAFRRANIEYGASVQAVKFSIQQRGEDRYVVLLSSTQPVNEPFLDMLVELDWNTGRLVREYTFLLDPPEYKGPQPAAPSMAAPVAPPATIRSVEMPKKVEAEARGPIAEKPLAATTAPARKAAPRAAPMAKTAKAAKTYQVKQGDTLTRIAFANKPESVSLQQMLIALYRSNTDAFDGNNINRMRAGKILNIPDAEAAAAVDTAEATRLVLEQGTEFNDYRRKMGAAVANAPERADRRQQSASGKITARVEDKPLPAKEGKDQLKLSKGEQPGQGATKRGKQAMQEDLVAKDKELKEANERIAMLEKNVRDMEKLLALKSQAGAQLQKQAAQPAPAPAPSAAAPKPAEAAKTPEPAKPAPDAKPAPKPVSKPVVVPPLVIPEPSLIDEILENELALYGGGGFLLLLFGGYGYYAWKRKKALQQLEGSGMGAPSIAVDPVFGAAGGAKMGADVEDTQVEFSQTDTATAVTAEEVDPIAEADVYMAYGRDVQAEEILKDALLKDPSRQAIRAKLLEIYFNRKDAKAFEAVAMDMHAATDGEGPEWARAVTLGAQLDPGNPLYGDKLADAGTAADVSTAPAGEAAPDIPLDIGADATPVPVPEPEPEAAPGLDFDLGLGEPAAEPQPEAAAEAPAAVADATADLGFDLDLGSDETKEDAAPEVAAPETAVPVDAGASIDFDFELPGTTPAADAAAKPEEPVVAEVPASADSGSIDFDFNLELPEQKEEAAEAQPAPLDLSAISLDLGEPGETAPVQDAHWQEVATKLDLAKAYQEMGDKDGARELLNEVVNEGDAAQKEQAQTMLAALG